ncbi:MAG: nitrilase-related carbon-nitrogen hydrolase, partial [Candidatus Marinimicrobia bacterium]|nr:nitrilase-related carbon-nitrogen hydrolase [Candidatus Neomarinimicrobiota bacterium]
MKITLCQINPTVGAIQKNKAQIIEWYQRAIDEGADLIVFPELVLIGYPPQDLLLRDRFIQDTADALDDIANRSTIPLILGAPLKTDEGLYNCSFICGNGQTLGYYKKILLPTYDVFDEDRYFKNGTEPAVFDIDVDGKSTKIGLQICEDLWDKDYACNLAQEMKQRGADLIINISA